jgi:hypothetical protein
VSQATDAVPHLEDAQRLETVIAKPIAQVGNMVPGRQMLARAPGIGFGTDVEVRTNPPTEP